MTTLTATKPTPALPGWFTRFFSSRGSYTRQTAPEGAAELLARADLYESTQPSFAADLRIAAQRILEAR